MGVLTQSPVVQPLRRLDVWLADTSRGKCLSAIIWSGHPFPRHKSEEDAIETIETLRSSLVFSGLEEGDIKELARICVDRRLESGSFVFLEGDEPAWFYIVAEGRIRVLKHSSQGKEFVIAHFGPGEMFGEVAVFENKPYPASAQAVSDSRVLAIKRNDYLAFLARQPEVAFRIIHVLVGRLRDAQSRLRDLAGERAEQRIARVLLMLQSRLGSTISFTRQEIADMSGATIETTIRVMSRLKDRGIIRSVRGKTIIVDEAGLDVLSQSSE
ncbi:MAG: Crp/Fnr family transcriptional regulator [Dehalococcoidia bacterium]|nr:Crp/Fnr family transcriptional regulator [Dehalococcoidia bacterium]